MTSLTDDQLDRLEAIAAEATDGQWQWDGHRDTGMHISTALSGRPTVMVFVRQGLQGAQPAFYRRDRSDPHRGWSGLQVRAKDIAVLEVPYREDVVALDNPDARHIVAACPDVVMALIAEVREHRARLAELVPA